MLKTLAIAGQNQGLDIDARCDGTGQCIDNNLWEVGALGNDSIRQVVTNGETLLLVELSGVHEDFRGDDGSLTVKLYAARDADDRASNNFEVPQGASSCCEFRISEQSLAGSPRQAIAKAPAQLKSGELSTLGSVDFDLVLAISTPPYEELNLQNAYMIGRVSSDFSTLDNGLLAAGIPAKNLASAKNPYCQTVSSLCPQSFADASLLDLVVGFLQPGLDLDLDGDGLETLLAGSDGRVAECYDGCGQYCTALGPLVPAYGFSETLSCVQRPQIQDAYSVVFTFDAVKAYVSGVGR